MPMPISRRRWIQYSLAASPLVGTAVRGQPAGERPNQSDSVRVVNPRLKVPLSFIIDDSTCLVNLNRFAIPQFAQAWKNKRYHHDWRSMPPEIPDDFVREFGNWCGDNGVKGKYSVVPYPACVGRVDRVLPGWTNRQLQNSIELVQKLMMPNWDIHPEMVTHTIVVDTKTGQPFRNPGPDQMENWSWTNGKSVDELAQYMTYALKILKNVGLPCEGITTPGGFANRVLPELSLATLESVQDVFGSKVQTPHYFRHVISSGNESVMPRVENASGLDGDNPRCVVSIIACTGDWTGGWDCSNRGDVDRFITADLQQGRMVEVIERKEPAIMLCHWTGIYFSGEKVGFHVFQEAVRRIHKRFANVEWFKLSDIARYWAARELTGIEHNGNAIEFRAPFACPGFTVQLPLPRNQAPRFRSVSGEQKLRRIEQEGQLQAGSWLQQGDKAVVCFDLPRGSSHLIT